jgi:hypothetical protein
VERFCENPTVLDHRYVGRELARIGRVAEARDVIGVEATDFREIAHEGGPTLHADPLARERVAPDASVHA